MSWDLAFWKPVSDKIKYDPDTVYNALMEEQEPDSVTWLPVDTVKSAFAEAFPDVQDDRTELRWEGAGSSFEVSWPIGSKPRHTLGVLITCGWSLLDTPEVIQRLVGVAAALGCRVYDPQEGAWYEE